MKKDELLPCPYCGSTNLVEHIDGRRITVLCQVVDCGGKWASIPIERWQNRKKSAPADYEDVYKQFQETLNTQNQKYETLAREVLELIEISEQPGDNTSIARWQ